MAELYLFLYYIQTCYIALLGFKAYVCMVITDAYHSNPLMRVFIFILKVKLVVYIQ